jgi:capsular polysaccharide export protein
MEPVRGPDWLEEFADPCVGNGPRRIAFLHTDWELGMARMAADLQAHGHDVVKVVLNFADLFYRRRGIPTVVYRQAPSEWPAWLTAFAKARRIDAFIVYNANRPYNDDAVRVASELDIEVIQVEQGLIRPQHVTAYSTTTFSPERVQALWARHLEKPLCLVRLTPLPDQVRPVSTVVKIVKMTLMLHLATLFRACFPHYRDQEPLRFRRYLKVVRHALVRLFTRGNDIKVVERCASDWRKRYFLIPLQMPHDVQITHHSPFDDMVDYLEMVTTSFIRAGRPDQKLVIKAHPLCDDRYQREVALLVDKLGEDRVAFLHQGDAQCLLENALGVVTINSTMGLTALRHGLPVKVLGDAIYDVPELTSPGDLDTFWTAPCPPDRDRVREFVQLLELTIQGRGSLARRCFATGGQSGIVWPEALVLSSFFNVYRTEEQ